MGDWRVARALLTLRDEVNAKHPDRSKESDGFIGDAPHSERKSDHNPNSAGVVTAWDITTDDFTDDMAEWLREIAAQGDPRVKYVIYKGRITSASHDWEWVHYSGDDPHTNHIHLSVSADGAFYDSQAAWAFENTPQKAPVRPSNGTAGTAGYEDTMKIVYAPQKATCALLGSGRFVALTGPEVGALASAGIEKATVTAAEWDTLDKLSKRLT